MSSTRHEAIKNNNLKEFSEYQTDSLFLLIGTNPLPNYVVCQLLAKPDCHIYLVHTDETNQIANRLVGVMELPDGKWTKIPVDGSNASDIFEKVKKYAKVAKHRLGLNYTGGTKSMAVHSYRAIQTTDPNAVFSYLDARKLKLSLELSIDTNQTSSERIPVGLCIKPSMKTLLALHGRAPRGLEKSPFHPEVCRDIVKILTEEWKNWCSNNLHSDQELETVRLPTFENLSRHWERCETLGDLATAWGVKVGDLVNWFDGIWLEDYILWSLQQVQSESEVHEVVRGLELKKRRLDKPEIDVVALRGYQLFAISCATTRDKKRIKLKLFEAYVRAHQLGGDEARVGVVSFAPDGTPDRIRKEIKEKWDVEGKFRVFGVEHLPELSKHLQEWFNSQY